MTLAKPKYDKEQADAICSLIEKGSSLRRACQAVGIDKAAFLGWVNKSDKGEEGYEGLVHQYARAREILVDGFEDDILELSDIANPNMPSFEPADRRTAIDAKKWLLSKLHAKRYGDKVETTLKGDKENPIVVKNEAANMTTEQLKAIEAIMTGKGNGDTDPTAD